MSPSTAVASPVTPCRAVSLLPAVAPWPARWARSDRAAAGEASGIGDWMLDQVGAAMVDGLARDGRYLYPAMPCES